MNEIKQEVFGKERTDTENMTEEGIDSESDLDMDLEKRCIHK